MNYFDYNATCPLLSEAKLAMDEISVLPLNPSSLHNQGRRARGIIEGARTNLLRYVGAEGGMVIFTSSASEANALALDPDLKDERHKEKQFTHLYISAGEHPSVLCGGRFKTDAISQIDIDDNGVIDLEKLEALLRSRINFECEQDENYTIQSRPLVSVQFVNSETGVIQPIKEIAKIVHKYDGVFHCDGVQALGRKEINMRGIGIDLLTLSSHKIGGPLGVGAMISLDDRIRPSPIFTGGGQERGMRAGTENVMAIAGFNSACGVVHNNITQYMANTAQLRDMFEKGLKAICEEICFHGQNVDRVANTSCFSIPNQIAQNMLMKLDLKGFALSAGSACSSGKLGDSHVLKAMNVDEKSRKAALRFSIGGATTKEDVEKLLEAFREIIG